MNSFWLRLGLAVTVVSCALPLQAANNNAAQSAKKAVTDAQKQVQSARSSLKTAEQSLQKAQAAVQSATQSARAAIQAAYKKHADELGLTQALAERQAAATELSQRKTALLTDLKSSRRYVDAKVAAEEASNQASKIRDDSSLSQDARDKQLSDLASKQRAPAELEHEQVENNTELTPIRQRYETADAKCRQLQAQVNKAAEGDEAVRSAKAEILQKSGAIKDEQQKVTAAQKALAQAEQDLQQDKKKAQQAQSKGQKKKKNKKG